jgi:hypothetical protein
MGVVIDSFDFGYSGGELRVYRELTKGESGE